ncbi:hypothetical protein KZY44_004350 [Vibrio vulnificus]|nr:hypothetical protein [Vibrio vulnificus]EGQ7993439.1 hypothetical protein [Vibrio vulnificus]EHU0329619.1 hypothetical protein [Vibrio vulnificus]EHU9455835.1 hypothetical protein [Vibrio vulnificus]EHV2843254.1 hypothetical protein [Vibrio vulnificus]
MSYEAKVFRVLIASPSDVVDEREIAVKTIQEWNDLNSAERQIVLLPLRWETHTAPEYGKRPQEVINRQMVDHCDLLIGAFWTRIGSPTGIADSGTLEEIERVASQGKPVMLYFSQAKKDPDDIDLDQLKALREFKGKTFPKALVENYATQIEFRDKLAKQIEIQLRSLIVADAGQSNTASSVSDIELSFSDLDNDCSNGDSIKLDVNYIDVVDLHSIPDFVGKSVPQEIDEKSRKISLFTSNKDYYRDYVNYLVKESLHNPVKFWLKNQGYIGARDIFIDMKITSNIEDLVIEDSDAFDNEKPSQEQETSHKIRLSRRLLWGDNDEGMSVKQKGDFWVANIELRALQPKREISPRDQIVVSAKQSGKIEIDALIYADTLAEPIRRKLSLDVNVDRIEVTAEELLNQNGIQYKSVAEQPQLPFN